MAARWSLPRRVRREDQPGSAYKGVGHPARASAQLRPQLKLLLTRSALEPLRRAPCMCPTPDSLRCSDELLNIHAHRLARHCSAGHALRALLQSAAQCAEAVRPFVSTHRASGTASRMLGMSRHQSGCMW